MEPKTIKTKELNKPGADTSNKSKTPDFFASIAEDFLLKPEILTVLTYLNLAFGYFVAMVLLSGHSLGYWYAMIYIPIVYIIFSWRSSHREKDRLQIAHRMPYFADALANSLSVGATLEQAFKQSAHYLKGKIKSEFNMLILKNALGKDLGLLLEEIDCKFPNTGLRYLISLLKEYRELGIGISPMLKRISVTLATKEEAEEKIRTILAAGSGYARLTIGVFAAIFLLMSFMLKKTIVILISPELKPTFLFLVTWTCVGIFIVTRVTSMRFAKNFALGPSIKPFIAKKEFSMAELYYYSGMDIPLWLQRFLAYAPLLVGFCTAYLASTMSGDFLKIFLGFVVGSLLAFYLIRFILLGFVQDQLISTIETFPDFLQVFIIGLNSGLNTYLAFAFAQDAIKGAAPKILTAELIRTKFAMQCGEENARTWLQLSEKLPFETIIDFCEIMVIAPMQGESIVNSIIQMANSYQSKKLSIIEKKATSLGQMVIPIIVIAFFPLFLFVIFGPLIAKFSLLMK